MFLHGGFAHLAGNMLFLWIYGDNVEHRLGPFWYLLAYLGTGAAATLFHTVFAPDSPLPLVGASGAISGALGFYFMWFPRNQVRLLLLFFPFLMEVVTVPARLLLGLYLIVDNLLPFLLTHGAGGGVAHGAHIGGFVAGVAIAWLMDRRQLRRAPSDYGRAEGTPKTPAAAIRQAVADERFEEATEAYFALDPRQSRQVLSPRDSLHLAAWLRSHGHDKAALVVYRRHLRDYPAGPGTAQAHLGAALIQLEVLDQPTAAYQHLLDALEVDPSPEIESRVRELLERIASRQKFRVGRPRGGRPW
jgi:membrane associated rhomboid family serine protease